MAGKQQMILEAMGDGMQITLGQFVVEAYWGEMLQPAPSSRWKRDVAPKTQRWETDKPAPGNWEEEEF